MLALLNTLNKISLLILMFCAFGLKNSFAQNRFNKYFEIYDDSAKITQHIGAEFIMLKNGIGLFTSLALSTHEYDTLNNLKSYIAITKINSNGIKIDSSLIHIKGNYLTPNSILKYDSIRYFIAGSIKNYKLEKEKQIGSNVFLIRLNSEGDTLWSKYYSFDKDYDNLNEVIKSEDGNLLLFGSKCPYGTSPSQCDLYVIKVDTNGNEIFKKLYFNTSSSYEDAGGIVSKNNQIVIFGSVDSIDYRLKPFIIILDKFGNVIKSKILKNINLPENSFNARKLLIDNRGGLILIGRIFYINDFISKASIIKLDSNLNVLWQRESEGLDSEFEKGMIFSNKYMIVGRKSISDTKALAMVSVYRENGNKVFERLYSLPNISFNFGSLNSLNFMNDSTVLTIGQAYMGNQTLIQKTWLFTIDTFGCLEPGCPILGIEDIPYNIESVKIYPNPASEFIQLSHSEKIKSYQIFDTQGKLMQSGDYSENAINVKAFANGMYYVHVLLNDDTQAFGKLLKE